MPIPRRSRTRFSRSLASRRRKLVWARTSNLPGGTSVLDGSANVLASDLLADYITVAGGDSLAGTTLMAVKGRIFHSSAAVGVCGTVGITKNDASQVQPAVSTIMAQHAPATNGRYDDWLYRDYFWDAPAGSVTGRQNHQYLPLNVRAKRRIDELNETIILYMQSQGGASVFFFSLDCLLALP